MSEGEKSRLFTEAAFVTQNFASRGRNASQGSAFVFGHTSVFDGADLVTKIINFILQNTLEPEMARSNQLKLLHGILTSKNCSAAPFYAGTKLILTHETGKAYKELRT